MGQFSNEKTTAVSLSMYSFRELEDTIIRAAELLNQGYEISSISDFTYNTCYATIKPTTPMFTIEFTKYVG